MLGWPHYGVTPTFIIEPFYFCMYIVFIKYTVYNLIKTKLMYFLVLSGCDWDISTKHNRAIVKFYYLAW